MTTEREKQLREVLQAHQPELLDMYPNTFLKCSCGWDRWNEQGWVAHMQAALAALAAPAEVPRKPRPVVACGLPYDCRSLYAYFSGKDKPPTPDKKHP